MKIYTSYFAQLRNFPKNAVPLSTALYPPKWYKVKNGRPWQDKRDVWNGLIIPPFMPTEPTEGSCRGQPCADNPSFCQFLADYRKQLNKLDFDDIMSRIERLANYVKSQSNFEEEPIVILLVFEKFDNLCSERTEIQKWFAFHGVKVEEWIK